MVLCSVRDVSASLREARRVLRPGGKLLFIEHVAAPAGTPLRVMQVWCLTLLGIPTHRARVWLTFNSAICRVRSIRCRLHSSADATWPVTRRQRWRALASRALRPLASACATAVSWLPSCRLRVPRTQWQRCAPRRRTGARGGNPEQRCSLTSC